MSDATGAALLFTVNSLELPLMISSIGEKPNWKGSGNTIVRGTSSIIFPTLGIVRRRIDPLSV